MPNRSAVKQIMIVATPADINAAVTEAINRILTGQPQATIAICGPTSLTMRVRTLIDLFVSREQITEEQARDIHIDLSRVGTADTSDRIPETRAPDQIFGTPVASDRAADDDDSDIDPAAFLAADDPPDEIDLPRGSASDVVVIDDQQDLSFLDAPAAAAPAEPVALKKPRKPRKVK